MKPIIFDIELPNTLLFLRGDVEQGFPDIDGVGGIWTTETCIAVSSYTDDTTRISIGRLEDVRQGGHLVFDGKILTVAGFISVEVVPGDRVAAFEVAGARTHIRIWTDSRDELGFITIAIVD